MPGLHEYLLFIAAGLLLNITPGADMLYVITSAARDGVSRGIAGAYGIFTGTLAHITLTVIGLSAMLATSAVAFSIIKYVGAAYLVYLGLSLLFTHQAATGAPMQKNNTMAHSNFAVFRRGALINVLNPKIALFFLAFLPQFIDPAASDKTLALAVLGLTFNVTGITVNCLVTISVVGAAQLPWVKRFGQWAQKGVGALFVGLGARLAFSHGP